MRSARKVAPIGVKKNPRSTSRGKLKGALQKKITTKKTAISVSKDRSEKLGAPAKRITITDRSSHAVKAFVRTSKIKSSELFHKKKNVPVKKKLSVYTKENTVPVTSLALLSSYRFPIEPKIVAIGVARYSGIFFVVVGAFFTLFFLNSSLLVASSVTSHVLTAATGDSLTQQTTNTVTNVSGTNSGSSGGSSSSGSNVNCSDPLQYLSTSCASLVNQKPTASFDLGTAHTLSGSVRVRVKVDHATNISLSAYNTSASQEYRIDSMSKISDDTWEVYWDTSHFLDGSYTLKALVSNGYGSYEQVNQQTLTVENNPVSVTAGTSDTHSIATSTTASTHNTSSNGSSSVPTIVALVSTSSASNVATVIPDLPTNSTVTLTSDLKTGSTEFNFSISASKADSVKISAVQKATGKSIILGYAYKATGSGWKFKWTTSGYVDGDYTINAQSLSGSVQTVSNSILVTKSTDTQVVQTASTSQSISTPTVTTQPLSDHQLVPTVAVTVQANSPVTAMISLKVSVEGATSVELYAQKRYSLVRSYLGKASKVDNATWLYRWDTTQSPNAEYALVAVVQNVYGTYEGQSDFVTVANNISVPLTATQESHVQILKTVASDVATGETLPVVASASSTKQTQILFDGEDKVVAVMDTYQDKINTSLNALATALRVQDQTAADAAKQSLAATKAEILVNNPDLAQRPEASRFVDDAINSHIDTVTKDVQVVNTLITQRTATAASLDSDGDGISDYDEVNIYKTDPYVADTDGDGVPDGTEVLSGHDPLNAAPESLVAYTSPKDTGIVREDILKVNSITTAAKNPDSATSSNPIAIISGKALPNSFVTLYIFSTPIVVTVKTDSNGSWDYRFDKELDNGTHQVYVGITDNSGQVVAKSQPFTFIKEAEAFSPAEQTDVAAPLPSTQATPSLFSEYMVYVVLSISVVAIGLVLIMLGLHLDSRGRRNPLLPEETEAVV